MPIEVEDKNRTSLLDLAKEFRELDSKAVIVGVMKDEENTIQIIASANEYGAKITKTAKMKKFLAILASKSGIKLVSNGKDYIEIPERSFIRSTFEDNEVQNKITETMSFYLFRAFTGVNTFNEVYTRAGNYLKLMIQAKIKSDISPENHPLTIAVKGSDKTLQGKTGKLVESITYKVVKE